MPHKIYAFADDGIEMLGFLRSVLAEHALGCSGTVKAVDIFEAEIALRFRHRYLVGSPSELATVVLALNNLSDSMGRFFTTIHVLCALVDRWQAVLIPEVCK